MIRKIFVVALCATLGGCAGLQSFLTNLNTNANQYSQLIGKDLIMVANILVQAECAPATQAGSQVVTNILQIVAPNSKAAVTVQNALATNAQVAGVLCPFASAIKASVGTVPSGSPSQVIM